MGLKFIVDACEEEEVLAVWSECTVHRLESLASGHNIVEDDNVRLCRHGVNIEDGVHTLLCAARASIFVTWYS